MNLKSFLPFWGISMAVHVAAFAAFGVLAPSHALVAGTADGDPDRVFVKVIADQDLIAVAATPAPEDSLASVDSKKEREPEKPEDRPDVLAREEPIAPLQKTEKVPEEEPEKEVEKKPEQEKQPNKDKEDSVASLAQVASSAHMRRAALGNELRDFQTLLLAAIRQATFFPKEALKERRHGQVVVAFTISRDGKLSQLQVVGPSGCIHLDSAATEIVAKASASFPPFPPLADRDSLDYTVPIVFKEKNTNEAPQRTSQR
jgi:periplasmic protein TonB